MTGDPLSNGQERVRIPIVGLSCIASERIPLERALSSVPGVVEAYVNAADDCVYLDVEAVGFLMAEALAVIERFGARVVRPTARST